MTPVLRWIKSHLVVVICAIVILAAPITAWVISSGMSSSLRTELQQTASKVKELDRYRSTTVALEVPGGDPISVRGVVNPRLLEAYESAVTTIASQA
jgi:FlaG/FlaF family flagellin (archaellin)